MDFSTVAHLDVVDCKPHVRFECLLPVSLKIAIFREMNLRLLASSFKSFEEPQ